MSLWFLLLIAFAISLQASHSLARTDPKRHSRKTTARVKSRSTETLISQQRLCRQCAPEYPDFLGKEMENLSGGTSSDKPVTSQNDYQCPTVCQSCVPDECQLPNCKCSNFTIPGKVPRSETPIIVIVTMQGAVQDSSYKAFLKLFEGLRNPNSCPATGTYFVSHLRTDYFLVQSLRSKGHEIGDNTVRATSKPQDYWRNASCLTWLGEFGGVFFHHQARS